MKAPHSNGQRAREAALGRFALAVLLADGPDAGDRLADIVREAVRLGLARVSDLAEEATNPWALPPAAEGQRAVTNEAGSRSEVQP